MESAAPSRAGQLARWVAAHRALVAELSADAVLQRLVQLARDIFEVEHAALVVFEAVDSGRQVIHTGVDEQLLASLQQSDPTLPRVLLSAAVENAGTYYGDLHLIGPCSRSALAGERDQLASLAATAAIALENSVRHEQSRRSADVLLAYGSISHELNLGRSSSDVLEEISTAITQLVAADGVIIVVPGADGSDVVNVVAGPLAGRRLHSQEDLARDVMATARGIIVDDVPARLKRIRGTEDVPAAALVRHLMAVPLAGDASARGAAMIYRNRAKPFDEQDLEIATAFARQAALAIDGAESRAAQARLGLLELRGKIAQELNRHVVQAIFSIGLELRAVSGLAELEPYSEKLAASVESLDEAARGIRATIYPLPRASVPLPGRTGSVPLTESVLAALVELGPVLGFEPTLLLAGPLTTVADPVLASDVLAVVREGLTNTAKYARATEAAVHLVVEDERLVVTVADNGRGLGVSSRRSGLSNLRRRAEARGGELVVEEAEGGGLVLRWSVPLSQPSRTPAPDAALSADPN